MTEITIETKRYAELLKAEAKLNMLEYAGVDNWDWYSDALNPDGEESYSDFCDRIDAEHAASQPA